MQYNKVAEKVRYFKETEEGQSKMASTIEKIFAEGEAKGRQKEKIEMVVNLLQTGKLSIEDIAGASGLSIEEVKELQASLS